MTAAPITAQPSAPPQDAAVLDAIAWTLAVSPDWSADELTVIADLIGTVRPHPGELLDPDAPDWVGQLAAYHLQLTAHRTSSEGIPR
jgi:hypothetical protein